MTTFNEKFDEILSYEHDAEGCQALHSGSKCLHCNEDTCPHCKRWGGRQRTEVRSMVDKKTKQAITSLIKELVAEAKPDNVFRMLDGQVPKGYEAQTYGYDVAIQDFEQNILKAFEEA